jgi:anti-sigma B factor antagonist
VTHVRVQDIDAKTRLIALSGRLDASKTQSLKEDLRRMVNAERNHFVIDLADVSFIDSSGLSTLISLLKTVREHNGTMALANPSTPVFELLKQMRFNLVFPIYADTATALAEL